MKRSTEGDGHLKVSSGNMKHVCTALTVVLIALVCVLSAPRTGEAAHGGVKAGPHGQSKYQTYKDKHNPQDLRRLREEKRRWLQARRRWEEEFRQWSGLRNLWMQRRHNWDRDRRGWDMRFRMWSDADRKRPPHGPREQLSRREAERRQWNRDAERWRREHDRWNEEERRFRNEDRRWQDDGARWRTEERRWREMGI